MNVVVVTHLICAAAFAVLAVLLLAGRQKSRTGNFLTVACLTTMAWALAVAAESALPENVIAVVETASSVTWLLFMRSLLAPEERPASPAWALTINTVTLVVAGLAVAIDLGSLLLAPLGSTLSQPQLLARIGVAVLGLSQVENYYRNTAPDRRWSVVPLSIGIGAIFAFELFFYADQILSRHADQSLSAARALAEVLCAPLLGIAIVRNANWRTDLRVSHNAAFHAVTLISSGTFLLSVAFVGFLFRRYGGEWGMILQVTSLFGAAIVLATVLSSETARSGIRLAILRNFFSYRYDYRVEWLRCIQALSSGEAAVDLPERVIRAVADIVNSPGGVLFQRHDHAFVPSAFWNAEVPAGAGEPAGSEFMTAFRGGRWIQDLRPGAAGAEAPPRPSWLAGEDEFWLAVPLVHQSELIGFVVLMVPRAPVKPDWEVFDLLRTVARQAASYLSEQQAERALVDAHMLQEYSKRFAFVVHDIKNLSSQLGLILSNARRHGSNPDFQADVMHTVENSVARMNKLLSQLKMATGSAPPDAAAPEPGASADAQAIVRELVGAHEHAARIDTACAAATAPVRMEPEPLRSVLSHLINNAVEASGTAGRVTVSLGGDGDRVTIDICDQGPGMEVGFVRNELFRPFRSTKDSGLGLGAFQTRELIRAAGGQLEVISKPGTGTTMRIVLARASGTIPQISPAA
jgi:putative PEP-CTERM system histidine kinase